MSWGRRPAKTVGTRQDGEISKGAEVDSSMSEKPEHQRPRRLADWLNPTGRRRVHSLIPPSVLIARGRLRESGMRENRTYRLSGGWRPAPAGRASSDPTAMEEWAVERRRWHERFEQLSKEILKGLDDRRTKRMVEERALRLLHAT